MNLNIDAVQLLWEEGCNIIVGQSHFIKSAEDIPEIVVTTVPGIKYGFAFCEASGPCLIRTEGNDELLVKQARECARSVGAGHTFYLIIRDSFPINLLNGIKACQEVATIFAATANPLQVVVAESSQGRGIMGVIDGSTPAGVEGEDEKRERKEFLRKIGYKFG